MIELEKSYIPIPSLYANRVSISSIELEYSKLSEIVYLISKQISIFFLLLIDKFIPYNQLIFITYIYYFLQYNIYNSVVINLYYQV